MAHVATNLIAMTASIAAFQVVASLHAGSECWIQGLNYLVAAVPFGLANSHALHFRRSRQPRSRRIAVYYLVVFVAIAAYSWRSVEQHRALIHGEEEALAPTIAALEAHFASTGRYPASLAEIGAMPPAGLRFGVHYDARDPSHFSLGFSHNIDRKHSYLSESDSWLDWH